MYAVVIPAKQLPRHLHQLMYRVPTELETPLTRGAIVSIPFRGKNYLGVVLRIQASLPVETNLTSIKTLKILAHPTVLLKQNQLRFITQVADYYLLPIATVLRLFLPHLPINWEKTTHGKMEPPDGSNSITLSSLTHSTPSLSSMRVMFIKYRYDPEKIVWLHEQIDEIIRNNMQLLILVPEYQDMMKLEKELHTSHQNTLTFLGSTISKIKFLHLWNTIENGSPCVIVGTRLALFLPWKSLAKIILDREHSDSHKQWEMNPRIDTRTVAGILANNHHIPLILMSHTPRVETVKGIIDQKITVIDIARPRRLETPCCVNLKDEQKKKNFSLFSETVVQKIQSALERKQRILLLLNRTGYAWRLLCKDCFQTVLCLKCATPMTMMKEASDEIECDSCSQKFPTPTWCLSCQGTRFFFRGLGIDGLTTEIHARFPTATVYSLDAGVKKVDHSCEADIILATQVAFHRLSWSTIKLVVLLLIDTELNLPHFDRFEKTLQMLYDIENKVITETQPPVSFILQTYHPLHPVIQTFLSDQLKPFYERELRDRRQFHYSPYGHCIKLVHRQSNKKNDGEVNEVVKKLQELLSLENRASIVEMIGPTIRNQRSAYNGIESEIALKINTLPIENPRFRNLLLSLSESWIVDIDPLSL